MHRVILWMRNDLRLHDNPALNWAVRRASKVPNTQVLPVYCFDPRFYEQEVPEFAAKRKCGIHRTKFNIEAVNDLRQNLKKVGSDLFVAHDTPENFLPNLVDQERHTTLVYQRETCYEEIQVEEAVQKQIRKLDSNYELVEHWGATLKEYNDIPDSLYDRFPQSYTAFMSKTKNCQVKVPHKSPEFGQLPKVEPSNALQEKALQFLPDLEKDFKFSGKDIE